MLFGFLGFDYSKKTRYLINNYNFFEISITEPIKLMTELFGFEHHLIHSDESYSENRGISVQEFMELFSQQICHHDFAKYFPNMKYDGSSIWFDLAKRRIMKFMEKGYNIIVTDIRFPDEVDLILELGGKVINFIEDGNNDCQLDNGNIRNISEGDWISFEQEIIHLTNKKKNMKFLYYLMSFIIILFFSFNAILIFNLPNLPN